MAARKTITVRYPQDPALSSTVTTYRKMLQRCYNERHHAYPRYGGAGVTVCDRWRESCQCFIDDMGVRPEGMTIDRYPNKRGNYEPGNCRWATPAEQSRNMKSNHLLTVDGRTAIITDWCREYGRSPATVLQRLRGGWDAKRALMTPPAPPPRDLDGKWDRHR
jgi:hypothetical protein